MKKLINNIHLTAVVLILLTLMSTYLAQSNIQTNVLAVLVTLSVVVKGQQVVDTFMELNKAPAKWRKLLLSYIIIVPVVLALIIYI